MRILTVGDTHGNTGWWKYEIFPTAQTYEASAIVQVGDFGFWPGTHGERYLDKVSRYSCNYEIPVFWIDGNHEWFDRLEELGAFGAEAPTEVADGVSYLPRGYAWEWGGVRCLALGGAYSVDKEWRSPGLEWWPQEEITFPDVKRAQAKGRAKVMFTHDVPMGVNIPGIHAEGKDTFPASRENRYRLRGVFDVVQPEVLVHGHYHIGYNARLEGCHIVGLNCDPRAAAYLPGAQFGEPRKAMGLLTLENNDWSFEWTK